MATFPLLLPVEYWFNLLEISAIATAVAYIIIVSAPPSRLERFFAARFSRSNKGYIANRTLGYLVLSVGLFFVGSELYQYHFLPIPTWHH
jgi:hypothetical protein